MVEAAQCHLHVEHTEIASIQSLRFNYSLFTCSCNTCACGHGKTASLINLDQSDSIFIALTCAARVNQCWTTSQLIDVVLSLSYFILSVGIITCQGM